MATRKEKAATLSRFETPRTSSPGLLLWQVTNAWQRALREVLAPLDLTHVQFVLLATATWQATHVAPATQRELAALARTDAMMTSQVLRALEEKGLLTRERCEVDARAIRVAPTAAGKALARRAITIVETADAEFFSALGRDVSGFAAMLGVLAEGSE